MRLAVNAARGTAIIGSLYERLITVSRNEYGDDFPHRTQCRLYYDPTDGKRVSEPGWLIGVADDEIARYYRWHIQRRFGFALEPPSWGAHVTILRGEPPKTSDPWGYRAGENIEVTYSHDIYTNGLHWWLNIDCREFAQTRVHYGYPPDKRHYHLTIGRTPVKLMGSV